MRHFRFTVAFTGFNLIYNVKAQTENEAWAEMAMKPMFEKWRTTMEDLGRG